MPYFCTEDNCKLYYEERGEGKAVVFVHGWDCSRHHFKKQVPVFREKYKVLSYDLRGHGDSDRTTKGLTLEQLAKDLKQLIEYKGLKDVTLIGWSMGVHIIWEYIKQFGCDNITKCVYIDMTPKFITDDEWDFGLFRKYSRKDAMEFIYDMAKDWDAVVDGFIPAIFAKEGFENKYGDLEWAFVQARKNSTHVMMSLWLSMAMQDYRDVLPKITVPTLITYGAQSALYCAENSEYQQKNIKGSKLLAFEGCGHALHIEDPEKFNREAMAFIG